VSSVSRTAGGKTKHGLFYTENAVHFDRDPEFFGSTPLTFVGGTPTDKHPTILMGRAGGGGGGSLICID